MKKHMLFTYTVPKYLQLSLGKIRVAGKKNADFGTKGDGDVNRKTTRCLENAGR